MIIQQVDKVCVANVLVVGDDTCVFVLLCVLVCNGYITGHVRMMSPIRRTVIGINESVDTVRLR